MPLPASATAETPPARQSRPKGAVHFACELAAPQIRALAPQAITVLPIGSTEQHGPHLATGTDTLLNNLLQRELAASPPDGLPLLILPTLPIGASDHHLPFGGTLSLPAVLYTQVLVAALRGLMSQGHRRIFVLNSHGGNQPSLNTALAELSAEATEQKILLGGGSYWSFCTARWQQEMPELKLPRVGHACEIETSMLITGYPHLTPAHLPEQGTDFPHYLLEGWSIAANYPALSANGFVGYPAEASLAKGQKLLAIAVEELSAFFTRFSERALTEDLRSKHAQQA